MVIKGANHTQGTGEIIAHLPPDSYSTAKSLFNPAAIKTGETEINSHSYRIGFVNGGDIRSR